jgi:hypothetical protein
MKKMRVHTIKNSIYKCHINSQQLDDWLAVKKNEGPGKCRYHDALPPGNTCVSKGDQLGCKTDLRSILAGKL